MKKIKRIQIIVMIIITVVVFGKINNVKAEKVSECRYTLAANGYETFKVRMSDKDKVTFASNDSLKEKKIDMTIFPVVDHVLYCPENVYMKWIYSGLTTTHVLLLTPEYADNGKLLTDLAKVTEDKVSGKAKIYSPIKQADGSYVPCSSPSAASADLVALNQIEGYIRNTDEAGLKTVLDKLKAFDARKYCADEDKEAISNKISSVYSTYNKAIEQSSLSKEEKDKMTKEADNDMQEKTEIDLPDFEPVAFSCRRLSPRIRNVISKILTWVRILVPIALIILVSIDFAQAVISQDQEAVKKAISKSIKRAIAALVVFFIPFIVQLMINWLDKVEYDAKELENIDTSSMFCEEIYK